jgi:hypothetical protein
LGQVRFVDCKGDGDCADEDAEDEDRLAFSGLAVEVVDEVSQHREAFPYLTGTAGSGPGRAAGAGNIGGYTGHAAASLGVIPMPRAQVTLDERQVSEDPCDRHWRR